MEGFEPQAAQAQAHQNYIDAVDAFREAQDSGDDSAIRRASARAAATKTEWHRLVRLAGDAQRKRSS
ncbi:MAG: hypothetical protein ACR2N7_01530 [Acidimicrobiia bacterium]